MGKEYESNNLSAINFVNFDLSKKYESSKSFTDFNNKMLEVDYVKLNDNKHASSIFKLLLSALEKNFKKQRHSC